MRFGMPLSSRRESVQVHSAEELIDAIYAFLYLPSGAGPRVGVLGGGGAISVAASDSLERLGLSVPVLSPTILAKLRPFFPPVGNSLKNPVDLGNPMIPPSLLKKVMEAAGEDKGIDTLIIIQILFYILFQNRHGWGWMTGRLSQFSFQPELLKACQEVERKYRKSDHSGPAGHRHGRPPGRPGNRMAPRKG